MSEKIKLVQGDTRPQVAITVTDENTGTPVSLVGGTLVMKFRAVGSTVVLQSIAGTLLPGVDKPDGTVDSTPPYNINGSGGRAVFIWPAGSLNIDPGEYEGEIEITFADGTKQTVWDIQKFKLREQF